MQAKGKNDVHGEVESEGSLTQSSGLRNTNHIRGISRGHGCNTNQTQKLPVPESVNAAGKWNEGEASCPGRSRGWAKVEYEARLKQDLS